MISPLAQLPSPGQPTFYSASMAGMLARARLSNKRISVQFLYQAS
jgi:hypothetical protein